MVQIVEVHNEGGVDWYVSFSGYNPSPDECVRCSNEQEAIKLQNLINEHIRQWYKAERSKKK